MEPIVKFETCSVESSAAPAPPDPEPTSSARLEGVTARDLLHHLFGILFTVTEVADCLKVHRVKVLSWIHDGYLPAINVQSQRSCRALWRIRGSDLIRMAKDNVVNLPTHLQARNEDPFAGLVAVWDEGVGTMNLVSEDEAREIRERHDAELQADIDAVLKAEGYR